MEQAASCPRFGEAWMRLFFYPMQPPWERRLLGRFIGKAIQA